MQKTIISNKFCLLAAAVTVALVGCGSGSSTDLSNQEQAAFKGGEKGGVRSDAAKKGLADFQAEFNKKHGGSGAGAPPQAAPK